MISSYRLSYLSQRMAAVTLFFIIAMMLLNAACWLYPNLNSTQLGSGLGFALTDKFINHLNIDIETLPLWQKLGAIVLSSVPLLALAAALCHLRSLFKRYARTEYFSAATANHLAKVARFIGLWVVLRIMFEPLLSIWITMHAPAGHRIITLSFSSSDVIALFLAGCIAVIAHILWQASELHSENQQFV